jgi:hypothetical protein
MSGLDPSARALIDAARGVDEPSDDDRAATRAALAACLGAGAFVGTTATLSAGAKTAAGASPKIAAGTGAKIAAGAGAKVVVGGAAAKMLAVGVVSAAVVWGSAQAIRKPDTTDTRAPAVTHVHTLAPHARATARTEPAHVDTPAPAPLGEAAKLDLPSVSPVEVAPVARASIVTRPAARPKPLPTSRSSLGAEARLLEEAFNAQRVGDPAQALARLDEHASRYPQGLLRAESSAQRVLVLCSLGRTDDARAEADRFVAEYPGTPLALRVRSSCAGPR